MKKKKTQGKQKIKYILNPNMSMLILNVNELYQLKHRLAKWTKNM